MIVTTKQCCHSAVSAEEPMSNMFSWGEDWLPGFRLKHGTQTKDGVHHSKASFHIRDLSVNAGVLAFIKSNGDAFIIRSNGREEEDGRRVRSKQKFVQANIEAVCCSDGDVTLLSQAGTVLCGDPSRAPFSFSTPEALCNISVCQIASGSHHTIALTRDGHVFTWGQDSRGQLGLGKCTSAVDSPTRLSSLSAIPLLQIAAGGEHSVALSVSGGVFSWGRNHCGQLGLGDTTDRHTPTPVGGLKGKKTIYVSCGKNHTAILNKDGAVFTFGCGEHGQLGHNSLRDEVRPRMVAELWGAKVTKVACGRHHTLVLTDSNRVYSFGDRDEGQLGRGKDTHPSVPMLVQLPHDSTSDCVIQHIYAGGNSSFAICTPDEVLNPSNSLKRNKASQNSIDFLIDQWTTEQNSYSLKQMKLDAHRIFSSASCMNQSFLDHSKDTHFHTSSKSSGLDLKCAKYGFAKLMKMGVLAEVTAAVMDLLPTLEEKPVEVEGLRIFLILNELLHVLQKHKGAETQRQQFAETLAATLLSLSDCSLHIIGSWWSSLSSSTLIRHVKVWKVALSELLSLFPYPQNSANNILRILQNMYNIKKIPESIFFLELTGQFLQNDYIFWRNESNLEDKGVPPALILNRFNFLMDLKSKKMIFDLSCTFEKQDCLLEEEQLLFWPDYLEDSQQFFQLWLTRASFVEDAFQQVAATDLRTLKKPLVVYFDEDPKRTDVYRRDFFHHFFRHLVSTKSGMFMFNDFKTLVWFPSKASVGDHVNFYLFGLVCGLALYNHNIIHIPFPLVLFKKLLDINPTLDDMMEFSPTVGQCLRNILDYDECLQGLDIYFEINWDETDVELDPQNPGKQVTSKNKKEFVEAYVSHAFNTSVQSLFEEFERGFFQVCDRQVLRLFQPQELQTLLIGQDVYDWVKLKQNASYCWEYHPGHPNIQRFWEVFDELTEEQKKDFLWFVTGHRGVPVLGMDQIQIQIQVLSCADDEHFPVSYTCYSILQLPLYSTKEIMEQRLTEALKPERGFSRNSTEESTTRSEGGEEVSSSMSSPALCSASMLAKDTLCTSSAALHSEAELALHRHDHTFTDRVKTWWRSGSNLLNQGVGVFWSRLQGSLRAVTLWLNIPGTLH